MSQFSRRIRPFVQLELEAARGASEQGDAARAFTHLERAHVLGQASTALHVQVHWAMLVWAWRNRRAREAAGQVLRVAFAAMMTAVGLVPRGNTGGTNVSALAPLPIPPELDRLIQAARSGAEGSV